MKKLELLMEIAKTTSNDKIIDAVAFAIKFDSVTDNIVFALFVTAMFYFLYKTGKFIANDIRIHC